MRWRPRPSGRRHLEGDIKAVADSLRADLDEFLVQARQRPVLDRHWRRQRAQAGAGILSERMKPKTDSLGGAKERHDRRVHRMAALPSLTCKSKVRRIHYGAGPARSSQNARSLHRCARANDFPCFIHFPAKIDELECPRLRRGEERHDGAGLQAGFHRAQPVRLGYEGRWRSRGGRFRSAWIPESRIGAAGHCAAGGTRHAGHGARLAGDVCRRGPEERRTRAHGCGSRGATGDDGRRRGPNPNTSVSRARGQPRDFSYFMRQSTTLSTSSAISPRREHTGPSGHRPCRRGEKLPPRREPGLPGDLLRALSGNATEPSGRTTI